MQTSLILASLLVGSLGIICCVGLPIWLGIKHDARKRELEHLERIRAIESGRPIPGESKGWTPGRVAVAIGAGVPLQAFIIGWLAVLTTDTPGEFVWSSVGAIGATSVICGTILAFRIPIDRLSGMQQEQETKPSVNPEAFEMAGYESH